MKIPGYEPVELDLEKLFLLSVSKENLDFRGKNEKNLPYKISKNKSLLKIIKMMDLCRFHLSIWRFLHEESDVQVKIEHSLHLNGQN